MRAGIVSVNCCPLTIKGSDTIIVEDRLLLGESRNENSFTKTQKKVNHESGAAGPHPPKGKKASFILKVSCINLELDTVCDTMNSSW